VVVVFPSSHFIKSLSVEARELGAKELAVSRDPAETGAPCVRLLGVSAWPRSVAERDSSPVWVRDARSLESIPLGVNVSARHGTKRVLALALVLAGAILGLRFALPGAADSVGMLFMIPVVLVAVEFGFWGGLVAGAMGATLSVVALMIVGLPTSLAGDLNRLIAFTLVGGLLGRQVAQRAHVESESSRWLEMSHDLIATASLDGYFTRLNPAWERCLGYSAQEIMEQPYVELVHPDDLASTIAAAGSLADGPSQIVDFENRYRHKDGGWRWILWSACSDGDQIYVAGKDITERKSDDQRRAQLLTEEQVLARTDRVTRLPNRLAWEEQLQIQFARAGTGSNALAVLMIDLDRFKEFNDTNGHQAGDAHLKAAGASWLAATRETDYLARIGGDEFALLLPNCSPKQAAQLVERLEAATPNLQGCSTGLAYWDGHETPSALIARADRALYADKHGGTITAAV
jgi:diguanylate cyclase (GGDEF)-like protein/PAS domain S-box-containing protein